MNKIKIYTPTIRLKDALKFEGLAENGVMAKQIILSGQVTVNGAECLVCGKQLADGDTFVLDGQTYQIVYED